MSNIKQLEKLLHILSEELSTRQEEARVIRRQIDDLEQELYLAYEEREEELESTGGSGYNAGMNHAAGIRD